MSDDSWQPIESAPKDGGDIILLSRNGIRVAHWRNRGPLLVGWYIALDATPSSGGMFAEDATHWMPLPEPPDAMSDDTVHDAMLEMGEQADPIREALRQMLAEFGDQHYCACPVNNDSGPCDCFAGHLVAESVRRLKAEG